MKKSIGNGIALYSTPLAVVGAMADGKPNWVLVGHLGIIGHDRILVSLASAHYTNRGIREKRVLSVNLVDEAMLAKADYVGCVSRAKTDKSEVFSWKAGEHGAPVIEEAPVSMECRVEHMQYSGNRRRVVSDFLPNMGLTLPFVSYGLTSLVSLYMRMGWR